MPTPRVAWPALIGSAPALQTEVAQVKAFLRQHLYRHRASWPRPKARSKVVRVLFEAYRARPEALPPQHAIADYIAGMTDRFALREHERLTGRAPAWVR